MSTFSPNSRKPSEGSHLGSFRESNILHKASEFSIDIESKDPEIRKILDDLNDWKTRLSNLKERRAPLRSS